MKLVYRSQEIKAQQLAEKLKAAESTISEKDGEIARIEEEKSQSEAEIKSLTNEVQQKSDTIKNQENKVKQLTEDLKAAKNTISEKAAEIKKMKSAPAGPDLTESVAITAIETTQEALPENISEQTVENLQPSIFPNPNTMFHNKQEDSSSVGVEKKKPVEKTNPPPLL